MSAQKRGQVRAPSAASRQISGRNFTAPLTKDVLAQLVVAAEAVAVQLVHGAQLRVGQRAAPISTLPDGLHKVHRRFAVRTCCICCEQTCGEISVHGSERRTQASQPQRCHK